MGKEKYEWEDVTTERGERGNETERGVWGRYHIEIATLPSLPPRIEKISLLCWISSCLLRGGWTAPNGLLFAARSIWAAPGPNGSRRRSDVIRYLIIDQQ
jgi:hypothetical protein